ncbi:MULTISPECIES: hypothetical protein [Okeania]|nr:MULTISPECIES: hypothetical protein [Okeania]
MTNGKNILSQEKNIFTLQKLTSLRMEFNSAKDVAKAMIQELED